MGAAIRLPFRKADEPDAEDAGAKTRRNRLPRSSASTTAISCSSRSPPPPRRPPSACSASHSTPTPRPRRSPKATSWTWRRASFPTRRSTTCIALSSPSRTRRKLYPKGVVSKALQNVAFQDDGLIQYKSEVMLRIFEENVKPLIGGRAKAMIVDHFARGRAALFQHHQGEAQRARREIQGPLRLLGFRASRNQRGNQRARRQRTQRRRADRGTVRGRRLPAHGRGEQIPDRLRPAAARRHVPRQTGRGPQCRADGVAPEPLPRRQEGRGRRGLHQQRRGHPQGVSANTAKARRSSRKNRTRSYAHGSTPRFWRRAYSRRRMPPIS